MKKYTIEFRVDVGQPEVSGRTYSAKQVSSRDEIGIVCEEFLRQYRVMNPGEEITILRVIEGKL